MKEKILKMLRETQGYLSGQRICEQLQVSRTAVWKAINQLREMGYVIDSVNNKGYRLLEVPDIISEEEISSQLATKWLGHPIYYYDVTDSTNTRVKKLAEEGSPDGTVVIADRQDAGKGRLGRTWVSPSGCSVYMSYLLRPQILSSHASCITIVAALATACALEQAAGVTCQIKWPNDIVINRRKVCGILTEMSADMDSVHYVVVGIGVNVNNEEFAEDALDSAISLKQATGNKISRADVILAMLEQFEKYYDIFLQTEDLSGLLKDYNSRLVNTGRQVRIVERSKEWTAVARGIDEKGELIVEDDNGEVKNIIAGEVSVRGIYGYV